MVAEDATADQGRNPQSLSSDALGATSPMPERLGTRSPQDGPSDHCGQAAGARQSRSSHGVPNCLKVGRPVASPPPAERSRRLTRIAWLAIQLCSFAFRSWMPCMHAFSGSVAAGDRVVVGCRPAMSPQDLAFRSLAVAAERDRRCEGLLRSGRCLTRPGVIERLRDVDANELRPFAVTGVLLALTAETADLPRSPDRWYPDDSSRRESQPRRLRRWCQAASRTGPQRRWAAWAEGPRMVRILCQEVPEAMAAMTCCSLCARASAARCSRPSSMGSQPLVPRRSRKPCSAGCEHTFKGLRIKWRRDPLTPVLRGTL